MAATADADMSADPNKVRFGEVAQRLADNGYAPLPLIWGEKRPPIKDWQNYQYAPSDVKRHARCGVGILGGRGVVGVDIDILRQDLAAELDELAVTTLGKAPKRIGKAPKCLRLYRIEETFGKIQTPMYRWPDDPPVSQERGGFKGHKIEILAEGQQFVAFNNHPDTGRPYTWNGAGSPLEINREDLPLITKEQAQAFVNECERRMIAAGATRIGKLDTIDTEGDHASHKRPLADDPDECRLALAAIPNDNEEYDEYVKVMHAVKGALGDEGLDAFQEWSKKSAKHDEATNVDVWRRTHPSKIGAGTIYHMAQKAGWRPLRTTDEGNGIRLYQALGADMRWVWERRCFYYWDGNKWRPDKSGQRIMRRAKRALDCIWDELKGEMSDAERKALSKHALESKNRRRLNDAIDMLKSEGDTEMSTADFDADPWLLGVENGTVNLRSGEFYPGKREDYISMSAGCAFDAEATCTRWEKFVNEIMGGDLHLVEYLQRCIGYTLTASTRDQCFLFLWGPQGSNGKSTCMAVLGDLLGEYAQELPTATLAEGTRMFANANTPEFAKLKGARLAQVNEVPESMRFSTATIKDMTGGDRVTACAKYEDPISFYPAFKIVIRGNNQPSFSSSDKAFIRRLIAIPFTQQFAASNCDVDLPGKLRAELPGILNWGIKGCIEWQRRGLHVDVPKAVSETTDEWVKAQITFEDFVNDRCEILDDDDCWCEPTPIYRAYTDWFRGQPGMRMSQKQFKQCLAKYGQEKGLGLNLDWSKKVGKQPVRAYRGIKVVFQAAEGRDF